MEAEELPEGTRECKSQLFWIRGGRAWCTPRRLGKKTDKRNIRGGKTVGDGGVHFIFYKSGN